MPDGLLSGGGPRLILRAPHPTAEEPNFHAPAVSHHSVFTGVTSEYPSRSETASGHLQRMLLEAEAVGPGGFAAALRKCGERRRGELGGGAEIVWRLLWMRWGETEPEAALAASLRMDPEGEASAAVVVAVTRQHPQLAKEWLEAGGADGKTRLVDGPLGSRLAGALAREWWKDDPNKALAWIKTLPEGVRGEAWGTVVSVAALENASAAAVMTLEMPAGPQREMVAARVAEVWAGKSPTEAMAWVKTLSEEDRLRAGPAAMIAWTETDGRGAAKYLERGSQGSVGTALNRLSGEEQRKVAAVAGTWAKREPAVAAGWVAQLPEGPLKSEAIEHVLWHWTAAAPEESSRWLDAQPPGAGRDAGMAMLSQYTIPTDPAAATAWAAAISPGPRREAALRQALAAWLRKDHEAATAWSVGVGN